MLGVRKPDPRFYELACEALGVTSDECVFLDDLGVNLKPARVLGMHTIKVTDPDAALTEAREDTRAPPAGLRPRPRHACSVLGARCSVLGARCSVLGARCSVTSTPRCRP